MQDRNRYAASRAADADGDEGYGEIKIFSAKGRLGRVRYIGYSMGIGLLFAVVLGVVVAAAGPENTVAVGVVGYIAIFFVSILLTIQRAHDFNSSGWMSLLMFIPLVNLIFWFIPGTPGANRYGKRPPPNTAGAIVLACLIPAVFVLGIVAAITIPAYQDYAKRAEHAQSQQNR